MPEREVLTGAGPLTVKKPRVDDRREGQKFTSAILPPYLRRSPSIDALIPVLYLKGRLHSYQGYDAHQTVFTIRLGALLGARTLIMTNAAGGLRGDQRPGDLILIRDQINLTGLNPLRGELPGAWGPRFPDMTEAYCGRLRSVALDTARKLGIALGQGTYAAVAGPSDETPAEVAMLRRIGADMVGMSTALEIIAARHMGVSCLALSVITNLAPGVGSGGVSHEEVLQEGKEASNRLQSLLASLFPNPSLIDAERSIRA